MENDVKRSTSAWQAYRDGVHGDFYRIHGGFSWFGLLLEVITGETFAFLFWWRTCGLLRQFAFLKWLIYPFARLILRHYKFKCGISIPVGTDIAPGLFLSHFGGIVINGGAKIGANCNIGHGVTVGQSNRGKRRGVPVIEDCVFIGPGAVVLGGISVGSHSCIGANAVVTKDVPERAVVVGNPGKIISYAGSDGYINRVFNGYGD